MSKKQQPKKERFTAVITEHEIPVKLEQVAFSPDGSIKLFAGNSELTPVNTTLEIGYKRENGKDKILNKVSVNGPKITVNQLDYISQFDIIFAVDTNTKIIKNEKISVPSMQCCEKVLKNENTTTFNFYCFGLLCLKNIEGNNAEKIGIMILIQTIQAHVKYNKQMKVAIVTDHDLGNINKYNNREIPIYNDFYLPENFSLLYASSDAGKENLLNILISECDKESNKFFEEVFAGKIIPQIFKI